VNLLALDPGRKRVGIAVSHGIMAEALTVLEFDSKNLESFVFNLNKIIEGQKIDKIIVGLPLGKEGSETDQTRFSEEFAVKLKKSIDLPFEMIEESYSTTSASERTAKKEDVDSEAAKIILEQYLNENS